MLDHSKFNLYVQRMEEIRRLSSPSLDGINEAEDYSRRLKENYVRIGELAEENRKLLEDCLYPRINGSQLLSEEDVLELSDFSASLVNAELVENLDLPIANAIANHLLDNAQEHGDLAAVIRHADSEIDTVYALMNMASRISAYPEFAQSYRQRGLELGAFFHAATDPAVLAKIDDEECRELVLTDARYGAVFYENCFGNPQANQDNLDLLEDMLRIADDPRYRQLVPNFDWGYFRYRTLQYFALLTTYGNKRGFTKEQVKLICRRSEELFELFQSDPERYGAWNSLDRLRISRELNRYLAGATSREKFKGALLEIYRRRNPQLYDEGGLATNVEIPIELLHLFHCGPLSSEEQDVVQALYRNVLDYVFRMPNSGTFSFMLEYLWVFTEQFMELPGGMTLEDMMLGLLAALHPPTYVHSLMVASLTRCLCAHALRLWPELFVGNHDCQSAEDARAKMGELLEYAYHSALCHDVGKAFIMDTVFVYGRNLLDVEFGVIKTHPKMGASLLERYPSTAAYASMALGHHRWFDGTKGYPKEFDPHVCADRTILSLIQCADCLDAATDTIGRSYKRGKTLSEFIGELREGRGTQYAPWLPDLLEDPDARWEIEWLISAGRERRYRETYTLLKRVHEQASPQEGPANST